MEYNSGTSTEQDLVLSCYVCSKSFSTVSNRNKHIRNFHGLELSKNTQIQCQEESCSLSFTTIEELRTHLTIKHGYIFTSEMKCFPNMTEFSVWKENIETEEKVQFVKKKGDKRKGNAIQQYFHCNRCGHYNSQSTGKRKAKDTCKMGFHCTATMMVMVHDAAKVDVTFVKEHYGHQIELKHLRLPKSFRSRVAGQINHGVSFHRILDFVCCTIDESFNRSHLVTRADIRNIQKAFGFKGIERHSNDSTSVLLMFKGYEELGDQNPVVYYKLQGEKQCDYNAEYLKDHDIFIVIMHPLQCSMLKKFGHKLICVDSTHGTNGYNFQLTTVMVVDEFGEGFPVAWLICNREDELVFKMFFEVLKTKVGEIQTSWFMSDDAEQFYKAWVAVLGPGSNKLLCAWHVDRAWRQKLRMITNKEMQCEAYYKICLLREEQNENKFLLLLRQVEQDFEENEATKQFGLYFKSNYSCRPNQWAVCYRQGSYVNTNMYVESFHRLLKHIYMKGRVNKRLDKCIHILLNLIRDKGVERIIKLEKGKITSRLSEIEKRHRTSTLLDTSLVSKIEENVFLVKSSTETAEYTVNLNGSCCDSECRLICKACAICIHSGSCSCPDFLVKGVICKHIHLTARAYPCNGSSFASTSAMETSSAETVDKQNLCTVDSILSDVRRQQTGNAHSLQQKKSRGTNLLMEISNLMTSCEDPNKILQANNMLQSVKNFLEIGDDVPIMTTHSSIPANKCIERQREFFSTKKKSQKSKLRMVKPNFQQKTLLLHNLLGESSISHDINDHNYVKELSTESTSLQNSKQSCSSTELCESDLELLQIVTGENRNVISQNLLVEESQIITIPESVDDRILDLDLTKIKRFLAEDAWLAVTSVLEAKKIFWQCELCDISSSMQNMIGCEKCDKWFHFDCIGICAAPDGDWLCESCSYFKLDKEQC